MVGSDVLKKFVELTGTKEHDIWEWFPNGKDSVRLRMHRRFGRKHIDLIFTYRSDREWTIETVDVYLRRVGEVKNE